MCHLSASKAQGDLYLVAVVEELEDVAHLDVIVVVIRVWPELHFFDFNDLLLLTRLSFFLLSLVLELAVVHNLTDRRVRVWRNLDQIQASLFGHFHRAGGCHNTYIFAFCANQADIFRRNPFVDPWSGLTHRWCVMGSASYGLYPLVIEVISRRVN